MSEGVWFMHLGFVVFLERACAAVFPADAESLWVLRHRL